jgi:hypothetical protein
MGKVYEQIDETLAAWMMAQPLWFLATAPLDAEGLVNVSPRGHDTFSVLGPLTVGWVDLTGSGVETIAHLRENGRICVMFASFACTAGDGSAWPAIPCTSRWSPRILHTRRPGRSSSWTSSASATPAVMACR